MKRPDITSSLTIRPLRLGILPGESPDVVRNLNEPLRLSCQRALNRPVELIVGATYSSIGDALRLRQVDVAFLGPVAYILQRRDRPLEPFARPTHPGMTGPTFKAAIIVPASSPVTSLHDLRGKEIAFGDLASTSGNWVPRYQLLDAGLVADRDYVRRHLGAHDAVANAVALRQVAAGCLSLTVLQRLLDKGALAPDSVRILAESSAIPEYMWTFREGLEASLREDIRAAFITMRDIAALEAYRASAFIPAVDSDVDRVRHWMEAILQARLQDSPIPWKTNASAIAWPQVSETRPQRYASHPSTAN